MGSGEQVEKGASFKSVVLCYLHSFGLKYSGFVVPSSFVIRISSLSLNPCHPCYPWLSAPT